MGRSRRELRRPGVERRIRVALLAVLVATVVGAGIWLSLPKIPSRSGGVDRELVITMAGFSPRQLELRAGRQTRLRLVNPDSPYHSDGGGVHGFTVPGLAIDVKVPPRSTMEIDLPPAAPGEYRFYCDTCCGGKENPSMWGVLKVRA